MPWSWGYNYSGILGRNVTTNPASNPLLMTFPDGVKIVDIRVSEGSGVALSDDGHVYVWGLNRYTTGRYVFGGQFGTTSAADNIITPTLLTYSEASGVAEVAISNRATFWRTSDGNVYAVGNNSNGEFGTGETANTYHSVPVHLTGLPLVKRIFSWHDGFGLFAIDTSDQLWFAGSNTYAMNGSGASSGNILTHALVSGLGSNHVAEVTMTNRPSGSGYTSGYCAVALMTDGTVWTWGRTMVGAGSNTNFAPAALSGVTNIKDIYGTSGSQTLYFLDNSGAVSGLGSDQNAALCHGTLVGTSYTRSDSFALPPIAITIPGSRTAKSLAKGAFTYTMMVVTNDDQIWGWGLQDLMWDNADPAPTISYKIPPIAVVPLTFYAGGVVPGLVRICYEYCPFIIEAIVAKGRAYAQVI